MTCLICAGPAEEIDCPSQLEERRCAVCGRYRISNALVRTLMDEGQIFDLVKVREWLKGNGALPDIPKLVSADRLFQTWNSYNSRCLSFSSRPQDSTIKAQRSDDQNAARSKH